VPIRLTELIGKISDKTEARVRRTRDQSRSIIQETLRADCRLVMRTAEEGRDNKSGAHVPVKVSPGYPAHLANVDFPDDLDQIMLLARYRAYLEQAMAGATGLLPLQEELLRRKDFEHLALPASDSLQSTADWAQELLSLLEQNDPLKRVLSVEEDFLGVYKYEIPTYFDDDKTANRASIELYWGVIGLVAEWMNCTVEDLTIVVLAHELAHAYTQLGADIEGRRWQASAFSMAETGLKEGLAQYYTDRVLRRLEQRYSGAIKVYETMLPNQPEAYRTHLSWVTDFSPEAVRRAMLEVRRWQEGKLSDFNSRLAEAQKELHPK